MAPRGGAATRPRSNLPPGTLQPLHHGLPVGDFVRRRAQQHRRLENLCERRDQGGFGKQGLCSCAGVAAGLVVLDPERVFEDRVDVVSVRLGARLVVDGDEGDAEVVGEDLFVIRVLRSLSVRSRRFVPDDLRLSVPADVDRPRSVRVALRGGAATRSHCDPRVDDLRPSVPDACPSTQPVEVSRRSASRRAF